MAENGTGNIREKKKKRKRKNFTAVRRNNFMITHAQQTESQHFKTLEVKKRERGTQTNAYNDLRKETHGRKMEVKVGVWLGKWEWQEKH